ncbi:hypothetical protein CPC08DRAFT_729838 [Agrocybe pediades]|nr:hypothetical protein CPC08DRAFT_729838 [Agrocybe pediades]
MAVVVFLVRVAENEIKYGKNKEFMRWKGHAPKFKSTFLEEMKRYGILCWWETLEGGDCAQILPVLAKKIFSVHVNSMPEERTVSAFTWITPPFHSRLLVGNMAARTQIRQHYATEAKLRKNSTPRPTVKFFNIKDQLFNPKNKKQELDVPEDDIDDSWLDTPAETYPTARALDVESQSCPINLRPPAPGVMKALSEVEKRETGHWRRKRGGSAGEQQTQGLRGLLYNSVT